MSEVKKFDPGTRVVVLEGPKRGHIGFISGITTGEFGGNRTETARYLVTDTNATSAFDWWTEVWHHDVTPIPESRPRIAEARP